MARRGRRGKKGRGKKAIPLAVMLPIAPGINRIMTYPQDLRHAVPDAIFLDTLGFDRTLNKFNTTILTRQLGLCIAAMVGHKIANASGVNKMMRKATMGYFVF